MSSVKSSFQIAIVGATGLVGQEMRRVLSQDQRLKFIPIKLFASRARPDEDIVELKSSWDELKKCRFILSASEASVAQEIASHLIEEQILIDNSSAFRRDLKIPLVIPEVNGELLAAKPQIVANPNCTAILLCMCLKPLERFRIKRVVVATYQAASGAGQSGLTELDAQIAAAQGALETKPSTEVFGFPLHMNVMSHNTAVAENGYNDEENKVISESRRILDRPDLSISVTCMRVPVRRAHTEAVSVDFENAFDTEQILKILGDSPGLKVINDIKANHFPMPLEAEGQGQVLVGRIRRDLDLPKTLHFILSGDQLLKGAALNAVQILEKMAF